MEDQGGRSSITTHSIPLIQEGAGTGHMTTGTNRTCGVVVAMENNTIITRELIITHITRNMIPTTQVREKDIMAGGITKVV